MMGLNTEGPLSWFTSHTDLALGTGKEAGATRNASLAMLAPCSVEWRVACGLSAFQCIDQRWFPACRVTNSVTIPPLQALPSHPQPFSCLLGGSSQKYSFAVADLSGGDLYPHPRSGDHC